MYLYNKRIRHELRRIDTLNSYRGKGYCRVGNRDKFKELAEKRVSRALNDLRLIGNLANRNNYNFEQEDVDKIFSALDGAVRDVKSKFRSPVTTRDRTFKL